MSRDSHGYAERFPSNLLHHWETLIMCSIVLLIAISMKISALALGSVEKWTSASGQDQPPVDTLVLNILPVQIEQDDSSFNIDSTVQDPKIVLGSLVASYQQLGSADSADSPDPNSVDSSSQLLGSAGSSGCSSKHKRQLDIVCPVQLDQDGVSTVRQDDSSAARRYSAPQGGRGRPIRPGRPPVKKKFLQCDPETEKPLCCEMTPVYDPKGRRILRSCRRCTWAWQRIYTRITSG